MNSEEVVNAYIGEAGNPWAVEIRKEELKVRLSREWNDLRIGGIEIFLLPEGAVITAGIINPAGLIEGFTGGEAVPEAEILPTILRHQCNLEYIHEATRLY